MKTETLESRSSASLRESSGAGSPQQLSRTEKRLSVNIALNH